PCYHPSTHARTLPHSSHDHRPPPTQSYTLSLHDALPISYRGGRSRAARTFVRPTTACASGPRHVRARRSTRQRGTSAFAARCGRDRKSTRLNSSHVATSYAVFSLKKKNAIPTVIS